MPPAERELSEQELALVAGWLPDSGQPAIFLIGIGITAHASAYTVA